jgi:hypothetical protein
MGISQAGYFEQALPPPTNLAQNIAAFYAQDHWKVNRRISVDYGLRFEHIAKPYSDPFGLAVFNPSAYDASISASTNTQTGITWHSLSSSVPVSGASSRLFFYSPRLGAAIDIFGTGKTVVRGGWGKYRAYDSVQSNDYVQPAETATGSSSWSCGQNDSLCPTWEDVDKHALTPPTYGTGLAPGVKGVFVMDPSDDEQPLVTTYSLSVDQELPAKLHMEVSYVGNYGEFFQSYTNFFNGIPLGSITTAAYSAFPADCGSASSDNLGSTGCEQHFRKFPDYTTINESITAGKSQYDSLQASVRRDVGMVTLIGNYTFSKALGDGGQIANGAWPGALSVTEAEHYLWGILPTDRAHALSLAYVFTMPRVGNNRFVRGAAGGWQLSGITQVESGAQLSAGGTTGATGPTSLNFQLTQGGANQDNIHLLGSPDITLYPQINCNPAAGIRGTNMFVNDSCFGPAPAGRLGNGAHLPYMAGPMFWSSDLTLMKNFKVTERQNLEFRIAAFNFLNHDLLSFTNSDSNLKLNFNDIGQVITGTSCPATSGGTPCNQTSTFGQAKYHVGNRLLEVGVKYSF